MNLLPLPLVSLLFGFLPLLASSASEGGRCCFPPRWHAMLVDKENPENRLEMAIDYGRSVAYYNFGPFFTLDHAGRVSNDFFQRTGRCVRQIRPLPEEEMRLALEKNQCFDSTSRFQLEAQVGTVGVWRGSQDLEVLQFTSRNPNGSPLQVRGAKVLNIRNNEGMCELLEMKLDYRYESARGKKEFQTSFAIVENSISTNIPAKIPMGQVCKI